MFTRFGARLALRICQALQFPARSRTHKEAQSFAATVAVRNVATEIVLEVATNAVGFYTVPNLTTGDY